MPKSKPLLNESGEVRTLSLRDVQKMRSAKKSLPENLQHKVGVRGPQKAPVKQRITIRLSPEVIEPFKETGAGWQTRVNRALEDWLRNHQPAKI
jgi:uncharacterized protein (DUF4415 family)